MNSKGKVYLIGAGCGDWQLITIKGLNYLKLCDCVIYDRLIPKKLLEFVPKDCKKIYVGKQCGYHSKTQEEINQTIVDMALKGYTVARLKGGDPFVFGRGGEEIQKLQEYNIPYEVISGISSSITVPSNVGIPVTHRSISRSFHVITGHTLDNSLEDFSTLAKLKGTIIFLMSLGNLETICNGLISNGMDSNTPCAIISKGTTKGEKVFKGKLFNIAEFKSKAEPPVIFVIGETTTFDFKSTIKYPLDNVSIAVTGTENFTSKLDIELSKLGAEVINMPHLVLNPQYDNIPKDFTKYTHIVFTSSNGVDIFFNYLKDTHTDIRTILNKKFATVGKSTADNLAKYNIYADIIPEKYTSRDLANAVIKNSNSTDNYLILRAFNGSNVLTDTLKENSLKFDDIKIYTLSSNSDALSQDISNIDYIIFGSSMGVKEFFKDNSLPLSTKIVCIGEVCKSTLDTLNLKNTIYVPTEYTINGIVNKLLTLN